MKLGNITRIKTGKLDANAAREGGIYPFFTCACIPLKIDRYAYDCECVLVAGNGDLNVKYYSGKFEAYQRTYIIESLDKTKLSTKYLFYFLSYYIHILRAQTTGGVIKFIKLGNLTEAPLSFPILETQKKIVAELDNIEEGIRVKETQLKTLDELIQSRFTEMFANQNFPFVYPDKVAESIFAGGDKPQQTSPIKNMQYPYAIYSNGEKNLGLIGFSTKARVTTHAITVSARGTIGLAILREEPFTPIVRLITLIPNSTVNPIYLTFYLNRERERGLGTSIKQLTLPMFSKKQILFPPLPLQNKFAQFVQQVEKAKEIVKIQIKDLQELLALKMDEYFK